MRIIVTLSYDGTLYFGSQIQKETSLTIFGQLEKVLLKLGIKSKVVASGRTDKGVHATGQVCHMDLPEFWKDLLKLKSVLNQMLPKSIYIKNIQRTNNDFHARYSAKKRVYRYIISTSTPNPFTQNYITFLKEIDLKTIQKNIKLFKGEHDFRYFMKTGSEINSTTRIVYKAFAYKHKNYIILNFEANGFLRSQIRLMVAALLDFTLHDIEAKLSCTDNKKLKPAPANGLYLAKIKYLR